MCAASLPDASIHLSVYSPPFCGLYHYSSSERDMSNCRSREEFFEHYEFIVEQIARLTMPGRLSAVHVHGRAESETACSTTSRAMSSDSMSSTGFTTWPAMTIWKPPLAVRMRTMAQGLAHRTVCEDSALADVAGADYVLMFRKQGANPIPDHASGRLMEYAGARNRRPTCSRSAADRATRPRIATRTGSGGNMPRRSGMTSASTMCCRSRKRATRTTRSTSIRCSWTSSTACFDLRSNPGETVLTPFMGVGSEVYSAVRHGRKAIGVELKESYFRQAVKNVAAAFGEREREQVPLFAELEPSIVAI